jgi:hypothetical protein
MDGKVEVSKQGAVTYSTVTVCDHCAHAASLCTRVRRLSVNRVSSGVDGKQPRLELLDGWQPHPQPLHHHCHLVVTHAVLQPLEHLKSRGRVSCLNQHLVRVA